MASRPPRTGGTLSVYKPRRVPPPGGLLGSLVGNQQAPLPPIRPDVYENDDVMAEVNRVTSQDSPLMRMAAQSGMQMANRRGLLNSSIAVGAAQAEGYRAALPIASQTTAQRASRNLARLTSGFETERLGMQIGSQERMQGLDIRSRETLAREQIASEEARLGRQLTSQEAQQQRDIAARQAMQTQVLTSEEARLGRQLTAQEQAQIREIAAQRELQGGELASRQALQSQALAAEEARLGRQLSAQEAAQIREIASQRELQTGELGSRERIAQAELAAAETRLGRQLTSQEGMALAERLSRETLTREELASQETRANLGELGATNRANLAAATQIRERELSNLNDTQRATLDYYLASNKIYADALSNLYANKDLPAPARDTAMQNFLALRNSGVNLPAIIFGTQLNWGGQTASSTPPPETVTAQPPVGYPPVPQYIPPESAPSAGLLAPPAQLPVVDPYLEQEGMLDGVAAARNLALGFRQ